MKNILRSVSEQFEGLLDSGANKLDDWLIKDVHKIVITGLSRSGKSMLFTSLMTTLKYRSEENYNCLPLLKSLPIELVEGMRLDAIESYELFPIKDHLLSLENQNWPKPTEQIYGFKLTIRLKETGSIKKYLLPHKDVVFEFLDYPGEWITDMPMLNKTFSQWSDSAWAQQMTEPQSYYAQEWHHFTREFNFDLVPDIESIALVVNEYRHYLKKSKAGGISLLQPGSFLISGSGFDWEHNGFAPLPTKVTSDLSNPWNKVFSSNYQLFLDQWLKPLKENSFKESDKQIILIDLFEGLNHSKLHLQQLKETLSNLSETFVYGNPNWFSKNVLRNTAIGKVAFIATKSDLIPESKKPQLLSLLQDITEGARAKFKEKDIEFEHFLVSAIQATDPGSSNNSLRYTSLNDEYIEVEFEDIPASLKLMNRDENFPVLPVKVPKDYLPRILNGRGMDRLFQYLLE